MQEIIDPQEPQSQIAASGDWYSSLSRLDTVNRVVLFLQDTNEAARSLDATTGSDLQRYVRTNPDFLLPQREWSPSRCAVKDVFTSAFCKTRAGLFSLLLFRLITYNTDALRQMPAPEKQVAFQNLEQWETYMDAVKARFPGRQPDFYCNRRAIGSQTQVKRVLANASAYWATTGSIDWASVFGATPLTLTACIKVLDRLRVPQTPKGKERAGGTDRVPQLGHLSQYLVCTDLIYAGVVSWPTAQEMGERIHWLNAGALKGLRLLGYCSQPPTMVDPKNPNGTTVPPPQVEDVIAAFEGFYRDVDARLSTREKLDMGWDIIMAEHTLCKLTRLKEYWPAM